MPRLSTTLFISAVACVGLALWSAVTFPIIKFGTDTIVRGRLTELIDRSQLDDEELESLDHCLAMIVSNDRMWQESHFALHKISSIGFGICAAVFLGTALRARRLEATIIAEGEDLPRMHS